MMDQAQNLRNIIKMQNQRVIENSRVIAVTSGKGGVGKSSTSVNIALQFQRQGKRVVIFDADFGLANVEVMFGVIPQYNLGDFMFKGKELKDIITPGPEGVGFISGGSGIARLVNLDKDQIKRLASRLAELEEYADVIIIDTGAGVSNSVMEFLVTSPETILVTTPEPASITDSYALLKSLSANEDFEADRCHIKLMANKVDSDKEGQALYEKLNAVSSRFLNIELEYLGAVPFDRSVTKAVMNQKPVSVMYPDSESAKSYRDIVNVLENKEVSPHNNIGVRSFFKTFFSKKVNG